MKWLKYNTHGNKKTWEYLPLYKNNHTDKENVEYFIQSVTDRYEDTSYYDIENNKIINQKEVPKEIVNKEMDSLNKMIGEYVNKIKQIGELK